MLTTSDSAVKACPENNLFFLFTKALLKSTNMTIQQISDELNFANQSFFGKYFKRLTGVSPKEYMGK